MPKEFYTEKDIEDLFQRGIRSLQVTENVVLTELAYEKANRLGLQLISNRADTPPAAPVRPYIAEQQTHRPKPTIGPAVQTMSTPQATPASANDIETRIRSAVIAKLGNQVDTHLLDSIIQRVVKGVGLK